MGLYCFLLRYKQLLLPDLSPEEAKLHTFGMSLVKRSTDLESADAARSELGAKIEKNWPEGNLEEVAVGVASKKTAAEVLKMLHIEALVKKAGLKSAAARESGGEKMLEPDSEQTELLLAATARGYHSLGNLLQLTVSGGVGDEDEGGKEGGESDFLLKDDFTFEEPSSHLDIYREPNTKNPSLLEGGFAKVLTFYSMNYAQQYKQEAQRLALLQNPNMGLEQVGGQQKAVVLGHFERVGGGWLDCL